MPMASPLGFDPLDPSRREELDRAVASLLVVRASGHPPSTSPITQSSGTNTSSKNTSLNISIPVSSRRGRMSRP